MTRTCGVSAAMPAMGAVTNSSCLTGTAGTWQPAAAASPADQPPAAITTVGASMRPAVGLDAGDDAVGDAQPGHGVALRDLDAELASRREIDPGQIGRLEVQVAADDRDGGRADQVQPRRQRLGLPRREGIDCDAEAAAERDLVADDRGVRGGAGDLDAARPAGSRGAAGRLARGPRPAPGCRARAGWPPPWGGPASRSRPPSRSSRTPRPTGRAAGRSPRDARDGTRCSCRNRPRRPPPRPPSGLPCGLA